AKLSQVQTKEMTEENKVKLRFIQDSMNLILEAEELLWKQRSRNSRSRKEIETRGTFITRKIRGSN
ncbi:unnamed protein product, partial [Ilex paraguariensis]